MKRLICWKVDVETHMLVFRNAKLGLDVCIIFRSDMGRRSLGNLDVVCMWLDLNSSYPHLIFPRMTPIWFAFRKINSEISHTWWWRGNLFFLLNKQDYCAHNIEYLSSNRMALILASLMCWKIWVWSQRRPSTLRKYMVILVVVHIRKD